MLMHLPICMYFDFRCGAAAGAVGRKRLADRIRTGRSVSTHTLFLIYVCSAFVCLCNVFADVLLPLGSVCGLICKQCRTHTRVCKIFTHTSLHIMLPICRQAGICAAGSRVFIFDYGGTLLHKEKYDIYIKRQTLSAIAGRKPSSE